MFVCLLADASLLGRRGWRRVWKGSATWCEGHEVVSAPSARPRRLPPGDLESSNTIYAVAKDACADCKLGSGRHVRGFCEHLARCLAAGEREGTGVK